MTAPPSVSELRLVVTVEDHDVALAFYRDALGLTVLESYAGAGGQVTILAAGRATLEINDPPYAAYIDDVEAGRRLAGHIRVAFGVQDCADATDRLVEHGATLLAAPTRTPWNSLNSRLDGPGDLQLTLFEDL
jgi:lactoylglutathione lyase